MNADKNKLGPAGKLANLFVGSKLTPILIIASLMLGLMAMYLTPREEEPQILVPMVDVAIPFNGASPKEVEERVTTPAERYLWGIKDVEYIYSTSKPGLSLITLRFKVGTELEPAVVRVHHKLMEHMSEKPDGVTPPIVRSYTIDDVPFLALSIHSKNKNDAELRKIGQEYARSLSEIADVSLINIIGGEARQIRIIPDPAKLAELHVSLVELFEPLRSGNVQGVAGVTKDPKEEMIIEVSGFLHSAQEVADIIVGIKGGRAVRVGDVAEVVDGGAERTQRVIFAVKGAPLENSVTLAFSKRQGVNATMLANGVLEKVERLNSTILPDGVSIDVVRNYGETAKEKSDTLIEHLLIASVSVVVLIAFALGIRFALVVGIAVPVTLALTLVIYYLFGYTLNRVTLFALIFSIGILVDDAIVVVENIHRHLHTESYRRNKSLKDIIVAAVNEVGNPTILATFTVIAAILPMAFVRGLMGPYMRPIPVGASLAMIFSLVVAFTISPWAAAKIHRRPFERNALEEHAEGEGKKGFLDRLYDKVMGNLIDVRKKRMQFAAIIAVLFMFIFSLVYFKVVRVKMLPFDNKNEFQVMIDLDEGTPLTKTSEVAEALGEYLMTIDEVENYQIYAGTSAPFNFNGLVRHYFLRSLPHQGDIQVNLAPKEKRSRQSHDIAKAVRPGLEEIASKYGARVKVVEIPPGPPVLSTLVSEVYGPDHDGQMKLAEEIRELYKKTPGVVDVDWLVEQTQGKLLIEIDRKAASLRRLPVKTIYDAVASATSGAQAGLVYGLDAREPVPIIIRFPESARKNIDHIMSMSVPTTDGSFVQIKDVAKVIPAKESASIMHKNLQRVVYVVGDLAGKEESPVYALEKLRNEVEKLKAPDGGGVEILSTAQPLTTNSYVMKWDGEWQITYEVFRDLGIAFAVVMILIYVLIVGWFESFIVPLVIMIPIPLSLIGIIIGHWMFGAFFTATSMIGFIAGAGIIVRNSIILVDFIELRLCGGMGLREAVINAGEVRFRPMLLTAAAVVVGSFVILFDPIFQGLAISLMMGEVAATLLSRFSVPLLYYMVAGKKRECALKPLHAQSTTTAGT